CPPEVAAAGPSLPVENSTDGQRTEKPHSIVTNPGAKRNYKPTTVKDEVVVVDDIQGRSMAYSFPLVSCDGPLIKILETADEPLRYPVRGFTDQSFDYEKAVLSRYLLVSPRSPS
ncbi:hypothetical protein FOZ63_024470, partial [Perkinsus olseni]